MSVPFFFPFSSRRCKTSQPTLYRTLPARDIRRSVSGQIRLSDKFSGRKHVEGQVRTLDVIVSQVLISPTLGERQVSDFEWRSTEFFAAQGAVETLDEGLVIL